MIPTPLQYASPPRWWHRLRIPRWLMTSSTAIILAIGLSLYFTTRGLAKIDATNRPGLTALNQHLTFAAISILVVGMFWGGLLSIFTQRGVVIALFLLDSITLMFVCFQVFGG